MDRDRRIRLRALAEDPGYDHDRDIGRELDFTFATKDVPGIYLTEVAATEPHDPPENQ